MLIIVIIFIYSIIANHLSSVSIKLIEIESFIITVFIFSLFIRGMVSFLAEMKLIIDLRFYVLFAIEIATGLSGSFWV